MTPTPRPWLLRTFGRATFVMDALPDRDGRCVANVIAMPNTNPDWEANAEFIVRAGNAHDDLLAALKLLAAAVEQDIALFHGQPHKESALGVALAAIAKAEGQAP